MYKETRQYYTAWDVGGAHLKCAILDNQGELLNVLQKATPVWQGVDTLKSAMDNIVQEFNLNNSEHVFTTTAELVDGFSDRQEGLVQIFKLLEDTLGKNIKVYSVTGEYINLSEAKQNLVQIASANWHATAKYLSSSGLEGLLIDIGSTTTDIIPFDDTKVLNCGVDDQERLQQGELFYTGIVRTPVIAVCNKAEYNGVSQYLMAEQFATMADVYRLTGDLIEEDDMYPSCDGEAKTQEASARRLGRMLGIDAQLDDSIIDFAHSISKVQLDQIKHIVKNIMQRESIETNTCLYGAGSGDFLVKRIATELAYDYKSFSEVLDVQKSLSHATSRSAAVVALAKLAWQ